MKNIILLIGTLFNSVFLFGQEKGLIITNSVPLDTISLYDCNLRILQEGSSRTYSINGTTVTLSEYEKVNAGYKKRVNCNPCFLKQISLEEKVNAEGVYYYVCPGAEAPKEEVLHEGKDSKSVIIRGQSCKEGLWLYYSQDGQVERKEMYEKGKIVE